MQLLSARGAQKKKDESKKLQMYSKQWLPGDTMRVFVPIFWQDGKPEIAVGAVWGHNVSDIKGLGLHTAFIPSTTEFDENATPIGIPDITYQFSQIARIFVNGAKAIEENNITKKPWPNEASRKEALKALEEKYDTKNNRKAVKPIIGRANFLIFTEVLSIKLTNDIPNPETIALSSMPLSNQTINRLYAILDDPKYTPEEGDEFLEIEWKYPVNADKTESARQATPSGLSREYVFKTQFPEIYPTVAAQFGAVMRSADTIVRRATRSIDPSKVRAALTQYAILNSEYVDAIIEEDEELLLKHVDLVQELDMTRAISNTDLVEKIQKAIVEMEVKRPNISASIPTPATEPVSSTVAEQPVAATMPDPLAPVEGAPTMQSIMSEAASSTEMSGVTPASLETPLTSATPSIQSLMNNVNNAGADSEFEDVDLDLTTSV